MKPWNECRNILCVRPDNMGDLIMSSPAIRALKESFQANITLLTSTVASAIVPFLPDIDDVITFDLSWVKHSLQRPVSDFLSLVDEIKKRGFDAAVIFTVFSQNPLPTAMIPFLAGVQRRLAYCRENPYELLTDWIPDPEPYQLIRHQVMRDLDLVATTGAVANDRRLILKDTGYAEKRLLEKIGSTGVLTKKPWIIFHAGVSEQRRQYPQELWSSSGRLINEELDCQLILTGSENERQYIESIREGIGGNAINAAGLLNMDEFICLLQKVRLVVSVNTGTAHIAAAVQTPVIVLYALTNPQHSPWMAKGMVMPYTIPVEQRSRNQILKFIYDRCDKTYPMVSPQEILAGARAIISGGDVPAINNAVIIEEESFV